MAKVEPPVSELFEASALPWQQLLVDQLVELKRANKLPHGLLIELQTSVNSINFGWYLVSALLCESTTIRPPCGECKPCSLMRANNYPDFTYTTLQENEKTHKPNKDIKIDQIRRLIHQISLTNSLNAGKYALIYPAEKMNSSSANSLLKTLEEPSDKSTLILLSHHSSRLPVTIRSRCQKWVVNNPDQEQALQWLSHKGLDQKLSDEYLKLSGDDPQLALEMSQQNFYQDYQEFSQLLQRYFQNQMDASTLVNSLKSLDANTVRSIVKNELMRFIHKQLEAGLTQNIKLKIIQLLNLIRKADWVLHVEDNNLNLQLQLEDVLISMKQILNRG
jgi:DNA polymerase III subunit delta'